MTITPAGTRSGLKKARTTSAVSLTPRMPPSANSARGDDEVRLHEAFRDRPAAEYETLAAAAIMRD
ncbi:MAG TPA: hypothetical protein VGO31_15375 [Microbacteriaceae bacterium]|nr:hypothetical protein [Microbacteriaceae bacterium]